MMPLNAKNDAVVLLIVLLVVLTLTEMWLSYRENRKYYEKRDTLTNIYLTTITFFLNLGVKGHHTVITGISVITL